MPSLSTSTSMSSTSSLRSAASTAGRLRSDDFAAAGRPAPRPAGVLLPVDGPRDARPFFAEALARGPLSSSLLPSSSIDRSAARAPLPPPPSSSSMSARSMTLSTCSNGTAAASSASFRRFTAASSVDIDSRLTPLTAATSSSSSAAVAVCRRDHPPCRCDVTGGDNFSTRSWSSSICVSTGSRLTSTSDRPRSQNPPLASSASSGAAAAASPPCCSSPETLRSENSS